MSFAPRPPDPNRKPAAAGGDDAQSKSDGMFSGFFNRLKEAALTPPTDVDAFLRLVKRGDAEGVKAQLQAGMSPDAANGNGETAAHIAARNGHVDIIRLLAKAGANLRLPLPDDAARIPLQEAIHFGKAQAAAELIICGGCPDALQATQELLHRACEKDMGDVVAAFAAAGVDLRLQSALKVTPMMAAVNGKKNVAAQTLLRAREIVADLNASLPGDSEGRTIFHLAVARADSTLIAAMIADGALVNLPRHDGTTPLLMAINRGDVDVVRLLLAQGADAVRPVIAPISGKQLQAAPLMHLACIRNMNEEARAQIASLLIEAGGDVAAFDSVNGAQPLHRLMMSSSVTPALAVFIKSGADINARNREGATPLMLAIEGGNLHDITNLLAAGADANARHDRDARTPLMIAATLGQLDTIRELLQAGANPRLLDNNGHSAVYYAQSNVRMKEQVLPVLADALRRDLKPLFRGNTGMNGRKP